MKQNHSAVQHWRFKVDPQSKARTAKPQSSMDQCVSHWKILMPKKKAGSGPQAAGSAGSAPTPPHPDDSAAMQAAAVSAAQQSASVSMSAQFAQPASYMPSPGAGRVAYPAPYQGHQSSGPTVQFDIPRTMHQPSAPASQPGSRRRSSAEINDTMDPQLMQARKRTSVYDHSGTATPAYTSSFSVPTSPFFHLALSPAETPMYASPAPTAPATAPTSPRMSAMRAPQFPTDPSYMQMYPNYPPVHYPMQPPLQQASASMPSSPRASQMAVSGQYGHGSMADSGSRGLSTLSSVAVGALRGGPGASRGGDALPSMRAMPSDVSMPGSTTPGAASAASGVSSQSVLAALQELASREQTSGGSALKYTTGRMGSPPSQQHPHQHQQQSGFSSGVASPPGPTLLPPLGAIGSGPRRISVGNLLQ